MTDVPDEGDVTLDDDQVYEPDEDDEDEDPADVAGTVPVQRAAVLRRKALANRAPNPATKGKKGLRGPGKGGGRILAKEKQRKALELRKGGASYSAIAQAVGYSDQGGARKAVMRAFRDIIQEPAAEVRTIQIERLNHMLLTLWPKVQQGDERAIDTSLRVMDKIDRLMGTEAASQVNVNVQQTAGILVIDGDKDDYLRAMKRMVGIDPNGSNIHAITASAPMAPPTGMPIDLDATYATEDVVEGEVLDTVPVRGVQDVPVIAPKAYLFGVKSNITKGEADG